MSSEQINPLTEIILKISEFLNDPRLRNISHEFGKCT